MLTLLLLTSKLAETRTTATCPGRPRPSVKGGHVAATPDVSRRGSGNEKADRPSAVSVFAG